MKPIALIVEDRPEITELWTRALEHLEIDIRKAQTLEDALRIMGKIPPPDLILLDLRLGDSDAEETTKSISKLKILNPNSVVIVISGMLTPKLAALAIAQGAHAALDKMEIARQTDLWNAIKTALTNVETVPAPAKVPFMNTLNLLERLSAKTICTVATASAILFLSGCVTAYENGKPVLRVSSNARGLHYRSPGGTVLDIDELDNAKIHEVVGNEISKGVLSLGTSIATSGVVIK